MLFLWLGPSQMPLPLHASSFPLFRHALSVYIPTSCSLRLVLFAARQFAGRLEIQSGSVKMRKHSAREPLVVMDGSKRTALFLSLASWFLLFLDSVREKLPCVFPGVIRFNLGAICCSLASASLAHRYGCWQPLALSSSHSLHRQNLWLWWGAFGSLFGSFSLAAVLIRSTTLLTL